MTDQPPAPPNATPPTRPSPTVPESTGGLFTRKRLLIGGGILVVLLLASSALRQPNDAGQTAGSESTPVATQVPSSPTIAPTVAPTAEPTPTATPEPTATPSPSPSAGLAADWIARIDAAVAAGDCQEILAIGDEIIADATIEDFDALGDTWVNAAQECASVSPTKVGDWSDFGANSGEHLKVKVARVTTWKSDNLFVRPDAGNRFVTAQIVLKGVSGKIDYVGYLDFVLVTRAGDRYEPEPAWRDPQLPYGGDFTLKPGKTVRGWVTYEVPKGVKAGTIEFGDGLDNWEFHL